MKFRIDARLISSFRGALLFLWVVTMFAVGTNQERPVHAQTPGSGGTHIYLPAISSASPYDLVANRIEVTQAVQDGQNSVALVAGRPTMLRIYTSEVGFTQASAPVTVSISEKSANNTLVAATQTMSASVPLSSTQANIGSTINYRLPSAWLYGTVDVTIKLDSGNQISEFNESNNTYTVHLTFNPVPPLNVKIVPIQYTDTYDNYTYPAPSRDTISDWIMRTYPVSQVNITWHAPVAFKGNLTTSTDFSNLLNKVTSIKNAEYAPAAQVYYGLIPTADGTKTWFHGGYAGLGWIGSRVAIGLDYAGQSSQIAAHEIGHNLGMLHTPCGATGTDPAYPYSDGSIGQYGLDIAAGQVYSPATKDVMSYCYPKWISDYTYKELYNNQIKNGAAAASALSIQDVSAYHHSLLLRANITGQGAELLPSYILSGSTDEKPAPGEYQVQVLGSTGEVLTQASVRPYTAGEQGEEQISAIQALIPLPDTPAAKIRLLKAGLLLAEQPVQLNTLSKVAGMLVEPVENGYRVRWAASTQPVLLRYSADSGATWTTLEVDLHSTEMTVPVSSLPAPNGTFEVVQAGIWK